MVLLGELVNLKSQSLTVEKLRVTIVFKNKIEKQTTKSNAVCQRRRGTFRDRSTLQSRAKSASVMHWSSRATSGDILGTLTNKVMLTYPNEQF